MYQILQTETCFCLGKKNLSGSEARKRGSSLVLVSPQKKRAKNSENSENDVIINVIMIMSVTTLSGRN